MDLSLVYLIHLLPISKLFFFYNTHAMQTVEVKTSSALHIRRRVLVNTESIFDVFGVISDLVQQEDPEYKTRVVVGSVSERVLGKNVSDFQVKSLELVVSNVCGKVTHILPQYYKEVHHPYVMPSVRASNNRFGRFDCLYSGRCNLLTSVSRKYTLFRGGHCMKETLDTIRVALLPETVHTNTVHMLVMSTRLGRPIQTNSSQVKNALETDKRWSVSITNILDDSDYKCSFLLRNFDEDTCRKQAGIVHGDPAYFPLQIKLMLTKRGSVNFFLSMDDVPLVEHETVLKHVTSLLMEIVKVIVQCT